MITKPEIRARRIRKLIETCGGGTESTNELSKLPAAAATELLRQAALSGEETVLLAQYHSPEHWLLVTSERLIWRHAEQRQGIPWARIHGVQQPPALSAALIRGELAESAIEELEVFDAAGKRYLLRLEPGTGYDMIWSAITALCDLVRPPDPVELEATGVGPS